MTDQTPFALARTSADPETVEVLEAAKEIATANPRVGREILRILTDGKNPPASPLIDVTPVEPPSPAPRPRRKSRRSKPASRLTALQLHASHCQICGASDQDEIDEAFINWESVADIAREYNIDRRMIYRHARGTRLFAKRDLNIRGSLGHIIQCAGNVPITADAVIRAVKTFAHMNARGEWFNPAQHVIVSPGVPQAQAETSPDARQRSVTPSKVFKRLKP
jgi:hypothetical protein